ncbi:MAG TPA: heme o synthase, partial [Thermoplasmata archaeon]|nr:heme o synthase [Thermoplasmata archaeon]
MVSPTDRAGVRKVSFGDYLELTKPTITLLIVLVAVGGYFVAAPSSVDLGRLGLLVVFGGSASAGAAMLNHYFDRDLDRTMRRTRHRPLAEARIAPEVRGLYGGLALTGVGWAGAGLLLNPLTAFSIALGTVTYVGVYTLWLKRRSSWNIVIGGFAGSAPALAGSAAAVGTYTPAALGLALLVFLWTPPHFWSLALLLREDYRAAGLPMLPRMEDPRYSGRVVVLSAGLLIPATALLLLTGTLAVGVMIALLVLGATFLATTVPLLWTTDKRW